MKLTETSLYGKYRAVIVKVNKMIESPRAAELYAGYGRAVGSWITFAIVALASATALAVSYFVTMYADWGYELALAAVCTAWVYSLLWSLVRIKDRIVVLIMELMMFTFLLDRPVIAFLRGEKWWSTWSRRTTLASQLSIYVGVIFIMVGCVALEALGRKRRRGATVWRSADRERPAHPLARRIFAFSALATGLLYGYMEIVRYFYLRRFDYEAMYTGVGPWFPSFFHVAAALFPYLLFAFLATLPPKKQALPALAGYIALSLPSFLLGSRNGIVMSVMFAVIYMMLREFFAPRGEKWFRRRYFAFIAVLLVFAVLLLGAFNYIRAGAEVPTNSVLDLALDFFYKQGTSYDTLCQGFEYYDLINGLVGDPLYTFGDIIDGIAHGKVARVLFGASSLGDGNNIQKVFESNSMAHRLSFVVLGERNYLNGNGRGSSFLIETFYDGGFVWMAIYAFLIGAFLAYIPSTFKKRGYFDKAFVLCATSSIFMLPRSSASGFYSFAISSAFWLVACIDPACRIAEKYIFKNIKTKKALPEKARDFDGESVFCTVFTYVDDRRDALARLRESLEAQTDGDLEWIVVDGTTVGTVLDDVLSRRDGDLDAICVKCANGGKHRAMNGAAKLAHGKVFVAVEPDDVLEEDAIASLRTIFVSAESDASGKAFCGVRMPRGARTADGGIAAAQSATKRVAGGADDLSGDFTEAYYTDIVRRYPFPEFADENFVPTELLSVRLADDGYVTFRADLAICARDVSCGDSPEKRENKIVRSPRGYALFVRETSVSPNVGCRTVLGFVASYAYAAKSGGATTGEIAEALDIPAFVVLAASARRTLAKKAQERRKIKRKIER